MTHPLTPREKVTHLIDNAPEHQTADELADDILAALASSGDHAELIEKLRTPENLYVRGPDYEPLIVEPGSLRTKAADALEDLLAENAALRAESENARTVVAWANNSLFGSCGYFHGEPFDGLHLARPIEALKEQATEAERKLAEAVGLNVRAAELMRQCTDPDRFKGASTLNVYANMRAWLSDLSKEAERG